MGKGGRGKKSAPPKTPEKRVDDEALLLEAAIAENQKAAQQAHEAKRAQVEQQVAVARRDQEGQELSRPEIVAKLDSIPAFTIVNADKQLVPLNIWDAAGNVLDRISMIWTEPVEAKSALAQARQQQPDAQLAIGTIPLGKALALCEGWAEAAGVSGFQLQGHSKVSAELKPLLVAQLEQQGLPTTHVFPVFLCEELSTDTCMPVFLSRAEMVSTWDAVTREAGVERKPPEKMTVMDLRILVARMQQGGMDWSVIKFVGTDRAYEMVKEGERQEEEAKPPPLLGDEPVPPRVEG